MPQKNVSPSPYRTLNSPIPQPDPLFPNKNAEFLKKKRSNFQEKNILKKKLLEKIKDKRSKSSHNLRTNFQHHKQHDT